MFILDSLLVGGLRFVFDKIALAVDQELDDEERLRERLLEIQMQLELGEIGEEEAGQLEAAIIERLRAIRARREPEETGDLRVTGVEAIVTGDFYEPVAAAPTRPPRRKAAARTRVKPRARGRPERG